MCNHRKALRIEYDVAVYHVMSRENERKANDEDIEDRILVLDILADTGR